MPWQCSPLRAYSLVIGWQFGPLVMVRAHRYHLLTQQVDARIVDSWIALELDPSDVRYPEHWRVSAREQRCVVAEFDGEWSGPLRRAYCGTRLPFDRTRTLAERRDLSPGVAFAWPRDDRGFVVPEICTARATTAWLKAHVPNRFMNPKWPADSSLDWMRVEFDRPLEQAVEGWTAPPPVLRLAYDPGHPDGALPASVVERRSAQMPNPAALAALSASIGEQVRAFDDDQRLALLTALDRDKRVGLDGAGAAFVPVAKLLAEDAGAGGPVRRAAAKFLQ